MASWSRALLYPAEAAFLALAASCLAGMLLLGWIALRNVRQIEAIESQVDHTVEIQRLSVRLQASLFAPEGIDTAVLASLREELVALRRRNQHLDPATPARLERLAEILTAGNAISPQTVAGAAVLIESLVADETTAQTALLRAARRDARREVEAALAVLVALASLGALTAWVLRRRFLGPLTDLRSMFLKLGAGDFRPIEVRGAQPLLRPLFENYNHLVRRLEELEKDHRLRAAGLESEVRAATEALLEQQRTLARAERLAAVGEMAATLAHELRNPLAGIQMSLANLRRDLADPQLAGRLDLALDELQRLTRLLNHQLSEARHVPEVARTVDLRNLVEELLALVRYQVPEHVRLEAEVDAVECALPRDRFRQALLNMVLNSAQAIGDAPGTVRIRGIREEDRLVVCVSDDGPGLPPEIAGGGGQSFATKRSGGTGLGLAMVRRLALDLGGELALENLEPRGARVRLVLPCLHG